MEKKTGLISVFVSKEYKENKAKMGLTWSNIIGLGFKYCETKEENVYLWGKIAELRERNESLNIEIKTLRKLENNK